MTKNIFYLLVIITISNCQNIENKNNIGNSLINKARQIHSKVITLDTHNDFDLKNFTDSINYSQNTSSKVNIPKMVEGGLDVSWLIVYTGQGELKKWI